MPLHTCQICGRSFSRAENLTRHGRTHRSTPPYQCNLCTKSFSRSDLLKKHILVHEKSSASPNQAPFTPTVDGTSRNARTGQVLPTAPVAGLSSRTIASEADGRAVLGASPSHAQYVVRRPEDELNPDTDARGDIVGQQLVLEAMGSSEAPSERAAIGPALEAIDFFDDFLSFANARQEPPLGREDLFMLDLYDGVYDLSAFAPNNPGDDSGLHSHSRRAPVADHRESTRHHGSSMQNQSHSGAVGPPHALDHEARDDPGTISRVPSPPNEASHEDYWPFAWNPQSTAILHGHPIQVDEKDDLLVNHNPRFDMSHATWCRVKSFLTNPQLVQRGSFTLPTLQVANAFIGLYFRWFSPQAPLIHEPTVDMDTLPPALLAMLMVIGSVYSNLRHTRRFAILVLDRTRHNLQDAIEQDQSLMRETHVIFALALTCYAGLWCGNKRAFEIAEAVRGTLVTYVRRLPTHHADGQQPAEPSLDLGSRWKAWITKESIKRLHWFVFQIDSQFPSLLNMRSIMSLGEASRWECPCDPDFWAAPTARMWKGLLGSASEPPTPTFLTTLAPFLYPLGGHPPALLPSQTATTQSLEIQALRANDWTAFLLLCALSNRVNEWSDEWMMFMRFSSDITDDESPDVSLPEILGTQGLPRLVETRQQIMYALDLWWEAYGDLAPYEEQDVNPRLYYKRASLLLYHLARLLLLVSLTDLQDAMGKNGPSNVKPAMQRLQLWWSSSSNESLQAAAEATKLIAIIDNNSNAQAAIPYSPIGLFLAHVFLWALFMTGSSETMDRVRAQVQSLHVPSSTAQQLESILHHSMASPPGYPATQDGPRVLLKHGAGMLVKLGGWGAALNLALLLHRRAEL